MSNLSSTADDILACARSLIIMGGYNGFSYADIEAVVGIRKASIHHHFPSKVDLVRALVFRYREDARAGFAELERAASDARDQLANYIGYWEKWHHRRERSFLRLRPFGKRASGLAPRSGCRSQASFRDFVGVADIGRVYCR